MVSRTSTTCDRRQNWFVRKRKARRVLSGENSGECGEEASFHG